MSEEKRAVVKRYGALGVATNRQGRAMAWCEEAGCRWTEFFEGENAAARAEDAAMRHREEAHAEFDFQRELHDPCDFSPVQEAVADGGVG